MGKRIFSFLLAMVMVIGMIPGSVVPAFAEETEQVAASYEAFVATNVTVDGDLKETNWLTSGKLSGGQAFDILWNANELYFALNVGESDTELTVKVGEKTILTAQKSEGSSVIEAKVDYPTKNVTSIENVTLTVGESTWTGNVNLVNYARTAQVTLPSLGGNAKPTAYGNGYEYSLAANAEDTTTDYRSYALKTGESSLAKRGNGIWFEFAFDPTNLVAHSGADQSASGWTANAGFNSVLIGPNKERIVFGIDNIEDTGLMFIIQTATWGQRATYNLGRTADDGVFYLGLEWTADGIVKLFVNGCYAASFEGKEFVHSSESTSNAVIVEARRFRSYNALDVNFKVYDMVFGLPTEVVYTSEGIYDAFVASDITLDGALSETAWRTGDRLGGGQAFDILFDGNNLYFGVEAAGADEEMTVKIGSQTVATVNKGSASAFEAKVEYLTKDIDVIEDVTITVGTSVWTGDVNLLKYSRGYKYQSGDSTVSRGYQWYSNTDVKDYANFNLSNGTDTFTMSNEYKEGAPNLINGRIYAMQIGNGFDMANNRTGDVVVEFDFHADSLPGYSQSNNIGAMFAAYGLSGIISDSGKDGIHFGIKKNSDDGKLYMVIAWEDVDSGATNANKHVAYIALDKEVGDTFSIRLVWTTKNNVSVYVDGVLKGTVENCLHKNTLGANTFGFNLWGPGAACALTADGSNDNKFTVSKVRVSKAVELTYITDETLCDGVMDAQFANVEPVAGFVGWDITNWENFAAGNGKVAALIYNQKVYLAVEAAGSVSATVGGETKTAEADGLVVLAFEDTTITEYGQEVAMSVSLDGTDVWAAEGKLTASQFAAGNITVMAASKGVIKSGMVSVNNETNGFTMISNAENPMYDNSHCTYWIYNKADLAEAYDTAYDIMLEQTIQIDKMPIGDVTGTFNNATVNQAWGYEIMLETPSVETSGSSDFFASVVYPDADGNLYLAAMDAEKNLMAAVKLGKKLGEEFKLGLLCGTDNTMGVYVDDVCITVLENARVTSGKVYTSAIMLKYMDPVVQTEGKADASMTIKNVTVTKADSIELINLAEEITQQVIFGSIDLGNVTGNLPLKDTFKSAYLGNKALRWESSNETIIETNGAVHPSQTSNKKVTLSVYLEDSETPLWSVEVTVPATSSALNALLSEETITVDGNLTELAWLDWMQFGDSVPGNIAAAWTKGYVFFAVYSKDADTLKLTLNGKEITVDLINAAVTGAEGVTAKKNAAGAVEIGVPLTAINFNLTDYNQTISMAAQLLKGETASDLNAELLNFSGDVAELQAMANYTKDNGPWTLLTNSIGYNGTAPGKVNYVYKVNNNIDHNELVVLSNEFQFDALPITTGNMIKAAAQADGFYYYFGDENESNRAGVTVVGSIFTEDGINLKLRISSGQDQPGHVFDLGKTLGEKFRITHYWYPNNDLELYLDGVLLAKIANAGINTSYLGIDVITYRYYSEKADPNAKVKFTLSNQTKLVKKYETVLDELTQNVVFGRTDLEHVQKDLPMVTTFASANFAALNLKWTSSDESVVAANGKITRHATEAKSAVITVYFVNDEGNEIKLWDVTVTVDPMSVTKQEAPAIIHTGFAEPGSIKVDGVVEFEENWLLNGWVLNQEGQPVGYFGAQWDQENLYLLLNADTDTVEVTVNGKTFNVELTGNATEYKIPVSSLGLEKIKEYNVTLPITVKVGEDSFEGTLKLTNVGFWGTDNVYAGLPMLANNVKSVKMGTTDTPDGNQGAKQLENGWRVYDLYGGEDAANPAGIRTYILFMKMPVYENFADRTEATHLEFDFYAKALPEWEWDEAIKNEVGRAFANYGVTFSLSDKADSGKNSNVAVFGIVNTADEGLVMVVNRGFDDYERYVLNKKVGEEFRIGLTWLTNSNLVLSIDGEEFITINNMSKFVNSVGDTSFVVNMLRNKEKPTSEADDMDVYLTNIGFGKAHSTENIIRNLTFDDIRGENETAEEILTDLVLPTYMTNGQLDHQYPVVWTSSDESVIDPATGKVTRPERGIKVVTLTATLDNNGTLETTEFTMIVMGVTIDNGNALVVIEDVNPFAQGGVVYEAPIFDLDKTNNSIIYAFDEDAESTKINMVVLTDLDEVSRLNRESLRLFVSDDNATYTEIENYKLHNDGCNWYLYGFEADARYIKVHYTHRDYDANNFSNMPGEMIHVAWNESLVIPEDAAEIAVPGTSLKDQAVAVSLPEGIKAEGLRIALNGEILFHYVDKNGTVYVRIPDPTSGVLKLWNAEGLELSDKENVYEVTYGTRETLPSSGRWILGMKAGQTFPDGSKLDVDTLYSASGGNISKSTDGGYTWTKVGSISFSDDSLSSGGWGIDSKTGRLFHEYYGKASFTGSDVSASSCITYVFYSDDGGKTWTKASGLGKVENDLQSNYVLSYTDLTELDGNDGEGPNVDFVFPMGAQYNNNGAFCGRVAYTTDGGKTWNYSVSKITYGNETAFEGGVSEATILEREDGTLVYYARCQSGGVDNFTISYSLDHGVTWLTPGMTSSVYTTNTQALMMTYDFDGFDGDRTTGSPIFMWGGNNVLGGNSYMRMPLNFAVSTNGMDTFRNIQNIFSETFMDTFTTEADHYITNPSIQQINGGDMYVAFSRLYHKDSVYMVVNDFTNWFTRTKGAYDSFERGDATYEGWIAAKGYAEATKDKASEGIYSMLVKENTQVTRSVPYLQNGKLSIDLYVDANSNFLFELQPAFSVTEMKCAVISAKVNGTTMTFHDGTVLNLKSGWNTVSFDLELTEYNAYVSINGGAKNSIAVNTQFNGNNVHDLGNYITYVTILSSSTVYVDELMVESTLDAVLEATEADKAAAEEVVDQIKELLEDENAQCGAALTVKHAYDALTQVQKDLVNRNVPTGKTTDANEEGALINYYEALMAMEVKEHAFGEWETIGNEECRSCEQCNYTESRIASEGGNVSIEGFKEPGYEYTVEHVESSDEGYAVVEEAFDSESENSVEIVKVFDINLENEEGDHVQPNGTVQVKLPLDENSNSSYKVYRVNDDGTLVDMNARREGDFMVFETDHFTFYVIVEEYNHRHEYTTEEKEPTCTESGSVKYTCSVCGNSYVEVSGDPLKHDFSKKVANEDTLAKEADCEHAAEYYYSCSRCDELGEETFTDGEALGHNVVLVKSEKATCEKDGYEYYACERCGGEGYTIILKAYGHDYEDGTCVNCGEPEPGNDKPGSVIDWIKKLLGNWLKPQKPQKPTVPPTEPPTEPSEPQKPSKPGFGWIFDWFFPWKH